MPSPLFPTLAEFSKIAYGRARLGYLGSMPATLKAKSVVLGCPRSSRHEVFISLGGKCVAMTKGRPKTEAHAKISVRISLAFLSWACCVAQVVYRLSHTL